MAKGHHNLRNFLLSGGSLIPVILPLLARAAGGQGGLTFLNDNTINAPPLFDASQNPITVDDADVTTLINNIQVDKSINVTTESTQYLADSLNRLQINPAENSAFRAAMKVRGAYTDPDVTSAEFAEQDEIQRAALSKLLKGGVPEQGLDAPTRKIMKDARRTDTDKYYVSREPHEFDYCNLRNLAQANKTQIEIVADAGDFRVISGNPPSLGMFIDAKLFRKTIELWRRLRYATTGKNAKALTGLLGTSRAQLLADLIAVPATKALFVAGCTGVPFLEPDV